MRIAIDAMGGDHAPQAEVQGALAAAREWPELDLILVGDSDRLKAEIAKQGPSPRNLSIVHASEVITTHEGPTRAFRTKKDASMAVAARLVKEGKADALLTAGSTGAVVVVGTLIIGRMKGIERPALGTIMPTAGKPVFFLDVGATPDCRPEWLVQFALMGDVYAREILALKNPSVALLSNGVEAEKGNVLTKAAYPLLQATKGINFVGNVEARDVPWGKVDVVVVDGFPGNIFVKGFEGVGEALIHSIKEAMMSTTMSKIGALLVKPALKKMLTKFDYTEYGGALLLGLNAPVVKCHGSSEAKGIKSGIRVMRTALSGAVIEKLGSSIARGQESQSEK